MGVKATSGGLAAEAVGEYMLAFAELETSLAQLFIYSVSVLENDGTKWDEKKRRQAEKRIQDRRWSAGRLLKHTSKAMKARLRRYSAESGPSVLQHWRPVGNRCNEAIALCNRFVHEHFAEATDDVLLDPGIMFVVRKEEVQESIDLKAEAVKLYELAFDVKKAWGLLVRVLATQAPERD